MGAKLAKGFFITTILVLVCNSLFAQWADNFDDGDFTTNPEWVGNISDVIIEAGVLRLNAPAQTGNSYLVTSSDISLNASWGFNLTLDFNPSSSNYAKVYIMADVLDLSNVQNGYFVKIGGTPDEISLYKVLEGSEAVLIDGVDGRVGLSNVQVEINITRNSANSWELKSKLAGESDFVSEGNIIDSDINSSAYFGVFCKYTSTRSTKFYFDNFVVNGSSYVDNEPPILLNYTTPTSNQITLLFNEPLDTVEAKLPSHFVLNDSVLVKTVSPLALDSLLLKFDSLQLVNTLEVKALPDVEGNTLDTTLQVVYVNPASYVYRDLVINEIFPDPNPQEDLPPFEFIELYNNSERIIDVAGWTFTDGTKTGTLGATLIFPDSFLIICPIEAESEYESFGATQGITNWPSLNNGGDNLTLNDKDGNPIDSVNYSISWYNDLAKDNGGWSLEQIYPKATCLNSCNWAASVNPSGGTPGEINSIFDLGLDESPPILLGVSTPTNLQVQLLFNEALDSLSLPQSLFILNDSINPFSVYHSTDTVLLSFSDSLPLKNTLDIQHIFDLANNELDTLIIFYLIDSVPHTFRDIVINELLPDPNPQEELPTFEFVELFNNSAKTINLNGWQYSDGTKTFTFPNQLIYPESFLIICHMEAKAEYQVYGETLGISNWPSLNNSGDSLTLIDNTGSLIDSLNYSSNWYNDASKNSGGWSLEQIYANSICLDSCNWAASVDISGGTPGRVNSIFNLGLDETPPQITAVYTPSITQITLVFNEPIEPTISIDSFILNETLKPTAVNINSDSILLEFGTNLELVNSLKAVSIADTVGNKMDSTLTVYFINPEPTAYRNIVINEIFADPSPQEDLPPFEFVELLNLSDNIIDLKGWKFADGAKSVEFNSFLLFPDSFLIICSQEAREIYQEYGRTLALETWPSLNNNGETLSIVSSTSVTIDSVFYTKEWYKNGAKDEGGWSLEQINPWSKCLGKFNWAASTHVKGGTPGNANALFSVNTDFDPPQITQALLTDRLVEIWLTEPVAMGLYKGVISSPENEVGFDVAEPASYITGMIDKPIHLNTSNIEISLEDCNGNNGLSNSALTNISVPTTQDIIINEILFNPYVGGSDFVEIYNNSEKNFNLKNYQLSNENNSSIITETTLVFAPQQYYALSEGISFLKNKYLASDSSLFETKLPTMPNEEGLIILTSAKEVMIDSVIYNEDYHFSLIDDVEGISLERISFSELSTSKDNWRSAAESTNYATPGYKNSQSRAPAREGTITVSPEVITPNNDGQADFTQIGYSLNGQSQTISINIYNLAGQLIKTIANNSIIAPSGFFTWDGTNQQGGVLPTAHYIIISEIITSDGRVLTFRNKVVVANGF